MEADLAEFEEFEKGKEIPPGTQRSVENLFERTFQKQSLHEKGGHLAPNFDQKITGVKVEPPRQGRDSLHMRETDTLGKHQARNRDRENQKDQPRNESNESLKKGREKAIKTSPKENPGEVSTGAGGRRNKSPLRSSYEKEVLRIQEELGGLEEIRRSLSLSQRQLCLLLMVDPSAWSRWVKGVTKAPPHIWRALEWYCLLQKGHPEYSSKLWTFKHPQATLSQKELQNIKRDLLAEIRTQNEPVQELTSAARRSPFQKDTAGAAGFKKAAKLAPQVILLVATAITFFSIGLIYRP